MDFIFFTEKEKELLSKIYNYVKENNGKVTFFDISNKFKDENPKEVSDSIYSLELWDKIESKLVVFSKGYGYRYFAKE